MNIEHADPMLTLEEGAARAHTSIATIHRSAIPKYRQDGRTKLHPADVDA
jgi:hypothetical protein